MNNLDVSSPSKYRYLYRSPAFSGFHLLPIAPHDEGAVHVEEYVERTHNQAGNPARPDVDTIVDKFHEQHDNYDAPQKEPDEQDVSFFL